MEKQQNQKRFTDNMKYYSNWRYWVMVALLTTGFFSTLCLSGEKSPEISEKEYWLSFSIALVLAIVSWYSLWNCIKAWKDKGTIEGFFNSDFD